MAARAQARGLKAGEVKVYNTIVTDAAQLLRGATQAFGATRERLLKENLGDFAPSDVVAPRSDGAARTRRSRSRSTTPSSPTQPSCSVVRPRPSARRVWVELPFPPL